MQETICAKVNPRLLSKADRLFTGTVEGRIIEILQNARRAGASEVRIANEKGFVIVQDNGSGIADFQKLLDLGSSGWDERMEAGEDPAGVGLFSLAPREVIITSGNRQIIIEKDGWTGKPIKVTAIPQEVKGTILKFRDEKPWVFSVVEKYVVFAGLKVIVDGRSCQSMLFCGSDAMYHKNPGCRIEVTKDISSYHRSWATSWYNGRILVNFHGQVVQLDYWPGKNHEGLTILVDITEKTDIRLMLPARTRLVENVAFEKLKAAIELEYYKYYQRQEKHTLYYKEYLRAKELGIELPEAEPQFTPGLIWGECNEPVEIVMPKDFQLEDCYLCFNDDCNDEQAETNAHLLAALGKFKDEPFVPVRIDKGYMGYNWSKLAKVTKVEVKTGKELLRHGIYCEEIACFDDLSISVNTSDGKTFSSDMDMAVIVEPPKGKYRWSEATVCVTKETRNHLSPDNIWFHLGGFNEDGDSYDTQLYYIEKELNDFWNELIGPYETVRQQLVKELYQLRDKWRKVTVTEDGTLEIVFKDGKREVVKPAG